MIVAACLRLFITSGDLIADRRYDLARDCGRGRSRGGGRPVFCRRRNLSPASHRPGLRSAKPARRSTTGGARAAFRARGGRPRRPPRRGAAPCAARRGPIRRRRCTATCARCSTSTRRSSSALVADLYYAGPAVFRDAVLAARAPRSAPRFIRRAHRSRCRSGLAGADSPACRRLGVDLSSEVIERARATVSMQRLDVVDMPAGCRRESKATSADLIMAAERLSM